MPAILAEYVPPARPVGHPCHVVIDNCPTVDLAKLPKLTAVLQKLFGPLEIDMPLDTAKTFGIAFLKFGTAQDADACVLAADGYKLDKNHTLACLKIDSVESYLDAEQDFVPVEIVPFEPKGHVRSWLCDKKARDHYVCTKGDMVSVNWHGRQAPALAYERQDWTESGVVWTPRGSYLATMHYQGIGIWGGPEWIKISRFAHKGVELVDFSPGEVYMVTWSNDPIQTPIGMHNLIVWEIATGVILRSFLADSQSVTHDGKMAWPILQWSHDDQYCARMIAGKQGLISVFGLPGMNLLDKKSIKVANLSEMMWQPNANVLAYSTPEDGNVPARVSLVSIPSREILRTRNIFNVLNSQMYWHPDGAYLLVQIERQKTKKSTVVSFEVLRMREKDIPVDIIEMAPKEEFKGVFWEPKGHRFCVLSRVEMKHFATFHQVETGRGTAPSSGIKALKKVEVSKGVSVVSWSPNGRFCVLCGVRGTSGGDLVFWDTEELAELASNVHFNLTDVQWDPSGRVFTSSVTCAQSSSDAGFTMWTMSGKELYKETATKFTNLTWRPRPPTLLTSERQAEITKDIKKYSKLFEQQDYKDSNAAMSEKQIKRQTQWREYRTYIRECEKRYAQEHAKRVAVYGLDPDAKKAIVEEKWVAIQETVLE